MWLYVACWTTYIAECFVTKRNILTSGVWGGSLLAHGGGSKNWWWYIRVSQGMFKFSISSWDFIGNQQRVGVFNFIICTVLIILTYIHIAVLQKIFFRTKRCSLASGRKYRRVEVKSLYQQVSASFENISVLTFQVNSVAQGITRSISIIPDGFIV